MSKSKKPSRKRKAPPLTLAQSISFRVAMMEQIVGTLDEQRALARAPRRSPTTYTRVKPATKRKPRHA